MTKEQERLQQGLGEPVPPWRKWGPYVSARAWGTVREDYSANGDAWAFLSHDMARSKAYRWGEDAIAGFCDRYQLLVFGWAFWNRRDPILKERFFGVTPHEGNHGEDVKEYYFYLDATPTHSYMKFLYKYPQGEFPYARLVEENQRRSTTQPEFELLDTGIFDQDRYFDIFIEYAKATPEDLCVRVEVFNRGPEAAPIDIIPQLWFRNQWSWGPCSAEEPGITVGSSPEPSPLIPLPSDGRGRSDGRGKTAICLETQEAKWEPQTMLPLEYKIGRRFLYAEPGGQPLFTNNETHSERVFGPNVKSRSPFVKDAFHRFIIQGEQCINPAQRGTKAGVHYANQLVPAGGSIALRFRLTNESLSDPLNDVEQIISQRRSEADEFYAALHPPKASDEEKRIQRQALAGLLWNKQIYLYHVRRWLEGDDPDWPPPAERWNIRNTHWQHLNSMRILSMPDKWEYPWFAAWDLAFQSVPLTLVDPEFAKQQLWLLLFEQFQHPNGQIPAYEWEFSDLNPPVQAWAVWRVYNMDRIRSGKADRLFLEKCFHKLLINFAWWVNKVDSQGNNIFEGGFLGLDNITLVDRSARSLDGAILHQSDGTGWMGMFCLNLMRIALELAKENKAYEGLAFKFFEHYLYVGAAMRNRGGSGYQLWDEEDGFFYDVLSYPNGSFHTFRVRSLVGLIPLFAIERLEEDWILPFQEFRKNLHWTLENRRDLVEPCVTTLQVDGQTVHVLAIIHPEQMRKVLQRVWDPAEFRSEYGLRSLSKYHAAHPVQFESSRVSYEPADAVEKIKGGNSNWRGPVWFSTTFMMIESLRKLRKAYGETFTIPGADGEREITLNEMAEGFANRLIRLFTTIPLLPLGGGEGRGEENHSLPPSSVLQKGSRAVYGKREKFQKDPHWRDYLLFYEFFNGDTGEGLGACHQTGWTALVASLIDEWRAA